MQSANSIKQKTKKAVEPFIKKPTHTKPSSDWLTSENLSSYTQTLPAKSQQLPATSHSTFSKLAKPIDALKEDIKKKYPSLFENRIGKMPGEPGE